jgi:hypothetical protein
MQLRAGDIFAAPKTVYWINMPKNIPSKFHIELLKKDILMIDCNLPDIEKLNEMDDSNFLLFFNLDPIIKPYREVGKDTEFTNVVKIINLLASKFQGKSIIHTSIINSQLSALCKQKKIPFIENNLSNWNTVHNIVVAFVRKGLTESKATKRSHIRIKYHPISVINVDTRKSDDYSSVPISGILNDISINGLSVIFENQSVYEKFPIKSTVELKIKFSREIVKISKALIVRKDPEQKLLGIFFDISNIVMIDSGSAEILLSIIHRWLNTIMETFGKFSISQRIGIDEFKSKYTNIQ